MIGEIVSISLLGILCVIWGYWVFMQNKIMKKEREALDLRIKHLKELMDEE